MKKRDSHKLCAKSIFIWFFMHHLGISEFSCTIMRLCARFMTVAFFRKIMLIRFPMG
ncbi:hypothetical protein BHM03_00041683 [Ensete ventricosum]|nr:hypothetical protein BHM03_00041683 [Ensete ventricosum]